MNHYERLFWLNRSKTRIVPLAVHVRCGRNKVTLILNNWPLEVCFGLHLDFDNLVARCELLWCTIMAYGDLNKKWTDALVLAIR